MLLLALLLTANCVLHVLIIGRYGLKGNEPPALFALLYAVIAMAAFAGWGWAPSAAVIVTAVGLVGLALNFRKLARETTLEKIIFGVGAAVILAAALHLL
jgi:hypothetical protein